MNDQKRVKWEVVRDVFVDIDNSSEIFIVANDFTNSCIAKIIQPNNQFEENAKLISAAPEMLRALQELAEYGEESIVGSIAIEAIKKATL